jgi:hypothetical protein
MCKASPKGTFLTFLQVKGNSSTFYADIKIDQNKACSSWLVVAIFFLEYGIRIVTSEAK